MLDPASRFLDSDDAGGQTPSMRKVLKTHKGPIYTCELDDRCPGLVEYPINEVMKAGKSCYLNNTVAYAVAFAYMCKVGKLSLYGVDYSYKGNLHFAEQGRGCVEYWLAKLISQGCKVGLGASSGSTTPQETEEIGRLYGGDWMLIPYLAEDANWDVMVMPSTTEEMTLEYMLFHE